MLSYHVVLTADVILETIEQNKMADIKCARRRRPQVYRDQNIFLFIAVLMRKVTDFRNIFLPTVEIHFLVATNAINCFFCFLP